MIGVNVKAKDLLSNYRIKGYDFVEISDFIFPKFLSDEQTIQNIENLFNLNSYNIDCIQGPIRDIKPEADDPEILFTTKKRFIQLIELASKNKVKYVLFSTTFDNLVKFDFYNDMWLKNNINFWREIVYIAENKNVICLYCNIWDDNPILLKSLFKEINSENFKFAFDIGHANYISTVSISNWISELGEYLEYVLIHDNNGDKDEHLSIGEGNINFTIILKEIIKINSKVRFCIQLFDLNKMQMCLDELNKLIGLELHESI